MAQYSNITKPAFYVPLCDYLQSVGNIKYKDDPLNDIHLLNPTKIHKLELPADQDIAYEVEFKGSLPIEAVTDSDGYIYIFILGHNFEEINASIEIELIEDGSYVQPNTRTPIINDNGVYSAPDYNGFSIFKAKYSASNIDGYRIIIASDSSQDVKIGCVSLCSKWNPPHSPDLSLTMTRAYDGVDTVRTRGGATLSNASHTRGGTYWANSYAWELTTTDRDQGTDFINEMERTLGRRIWNVNFSYIKDEDIMPKTESMHGYETSLTAQSDFNLYSQSFFSRVLNRIQGSHVPFIFQPNDTDPNTNPDQWAIARLTQDSLVLNQVANSVYDIAMNITESY